MQVNKFILIIASAMLSLFFISSFAAAQVTGGNKTFTSTNYFAVYGNQGNSLPAASTTTEVYDNHVTVQNNAYMYGAIYGGYSKGNGNVYENTVTIEYARINNSIYGGYCSGSGNVYENVVTVNSGNTVSDVYGGYATNGNANGNRIEISGTAANVISGYGAGNGDANDNTVIISGTGTITGSIYGGYKANSSGTGNTNGNKIEISGTATNVYAGRNGGSGDANGNEIIISGTVTSSTNGGYLTSTNITGNVSNNVVEVTSTGSAYNVYGGSILGATNTGIVSNNQVTIYGNADFVFGGYSSGYGDVLNNIVIIGPNATSNRIFGGITSGTGNVNYNKVIVYGTVDQVYTAWINNNTSSNANTDYNRVEIYGTITGTVWGGFNFSTTGTSNYNTVAIMETAVLINAELYGYNVGARGLGNTLEVNGFWGDVGLIANFDTFNFVLGQLSSNLECINITSGTPVDIDGATINITFSADFLKNSFSPGDVITVISDINLNATPLSVTTTSIFVNYAFTETYDTGALLLTVNNVALQSETKAVAEPLAAGLAFLGQAADVRSGLALVPQGPRLLPFAAMIYGRQHISTGSSITVKGYSALAGLAYNTSFGNGSQLIVGLFIEGGWGDYNSRNNFSTSGVIRGKGDTEYYGGGVLARYAIKSGLYGEGAFAAGKTETDFSSRDLVPGTRAKYDYSVPYYSAHIAVGQVLNLTDMLDLDVYGKYLWTRQKGEHVAVDSYRFKFKDADSHRLLAGGKLRVDVSPQLQPYAGAAYEYEFDGKVKGSLYGMNLDKPKLRGSTGIGELGLVWTPAEVPDLKVDFGVQGYIGKREGFSGGLSVILNF